MNRRSGGGSTSPTTTRENRSPTVRPARQASSTDRGMLGQARHAPRRPSTPSPESAVSFPAGPQTPDSRKRPYSVGVVRNKNIPGPAGKAQGAGSTDAAEGVAGRRFPLGDPALVGNARWRVERRSHRRSVTNDLQGERPSQEWGRPGRSGVDRRAEDVAAASHPRLLLERTGCGPPSPLPATLASLKARSTAFCKSFTFYSRLPSDGVRILACGEGEPVRRARPLPRRHAANRVSAGG